MKRLLAIGLIALSTTSALATSGNDVKKTANELFALWSIYQENCGPVPTSIVQTLDQLLPLMDEAEAVAIGLDVKKTMLDGHKDQFCKTMHMIFPDAFANK